LTPRGQAPQEHSNKRKDIKMDPMTIATYAEQGFMYALVLYLLWERRDFLKGLKPTLDKIVLLIEERLPKRD